MPVHSIAGTAGAFRNVLRCTVAALAFAAAPAPAQDLLIPMDESQTDHLRAYGVVYRALAAGVEVDWLLNFRGGAFLAPADAAIASDLSQNGVSYQAASGAEIRAHVDVQGANTHAVRLETAPRVAVYAPDQTLPWDDAVLLVLTYAGIPYERIYDGDVLDGRLAEFDWLHLHHEDFTGQYGKFYASYRHQPWYREQQAVAEASAAGRGFAKVSQLKLAVAQAIRAFVVEGGYLFAMCSGTDTFDIALAAHATDIVPAQFDADPVEAGAPARLDWSPTLAFWNFMPSFNPMEYEHSNIDVSTPPALQNAATDFFTLYDFSARLDPVPSMLVQNHVASVPGFMGQTTAFRRQLIKPGVVVLAESPGRDAVRYLYGQAGRGFFAFYAGHDPEDYQHFVGDPPTDLALFPHSPGYRLILNNVLFPAAKKEPQRT